MEGNKSWASKKFATALRAIKRARLVEDLLSKDMVITRAPDPNAVNIVFGASVKIKEAITTGEIKPTVSTV